jgi:methylated-DNA-[protein]-cysteine S-methyltransferase
MNEGPVMAHICAPPLVRYRKFNTPVGPFFLSQDDDGAMQTGFHVIDNWPPDDAIHAPRLLPDIAAQLRDALAGKPVAFNSVQTPGGPPFHRACWRAAKEINHGSTLSYGELARAAGRPTAARAAGQAMRQNPIPVIVPCHRILAAGGAIGGFAGHDRSDTPALAVKRFLLGLEGHDFR